MEMTIRYAASTGGFYDTAIHSMIPGDAVDVTDATHRALLDSQSAGQRIVPDDNGRPVAVDQAAPIPTTVTMRQARLALLQQGLLAHVDAAMQSAEQAAQIEWEYAQGVQMDSPLVASMRDALGLTDDDVLGLFAIAGGL